MSSNFGTWEGVLGLNPVTNPYVAGILRQFKQGDSVTWQDQPFVDRNGVGYDSSSYTLKYAIAGPIASPLVVTATANGSGWTTTISTTQSETLLPGKYSWQAQVFATNVRITLDEGDLTVEPDLAVVGANYDGRTQAQIALDQALAAYANFSATNGRVKMYRIGGREMQFDTLAELKDQVNFWRARVVTEKSIANGARDRHLHIRFDRIR